MLVRPARCVPEVSSLALILLEGIGSASRREFGMGGLIVSGGLDTTYRLLGNEPKLVSESTRRISNAILRSLGLSVLSSNTINSL